jgi:hypothetical protein
VLSQIGEALPKCSEIEQSLRRATEITFVLFEADSQHQLPEITSVASRLCPWRSLSKFARTLQKGQLITLEGTLRYREVEDEVEGTTFKHQITAVHATGMKRLSKDRDR